VQRGGGFDDFASECRAAHRDSRDADYPSFTTGFRVACIRGSAPASEGPLRLDNIGRKSIPAGKTLTFPVSVENANDWIGNLRFCLIDNPSDSARINSVTGEFTWQPDDFRENQTVTFTVFVSDAVGIQKDQQSFKVYVERPKNRPAQRIPPRIKRP
jgi:hypothetical protein